MADSKKTSILEEAPSPDSIMYVPFILGKLSSRIEGMELRMDEGFLRNDQAQGKTNEHLKELNGKVAKHETRLNDQDRFTENVASEAKTKAEAAAKIKSRRTAAIYSVIVSISIFVGTAIAAYVLVRFFHFNPFTGLKQ